MPHHSANRATNLLLKMSRQLTAEECNVALLEIYADSSHSTKKRYGHPPGIVVGVSFRDVAHEDEIAELKAAACVRAYAETGRGCGALFLLGWAGNSPVHCGGELNSFGTISILKCNKCDE